MDYLPNRLQTMRWGMMALKKGDWMPSPMITCAREA